MQTPIEKANAAMLQRVANTQVFYGWFDSADQNEPTYSPPLGGPCVLCGRGMLPFSEDVRTHSLMYRGAYAARSYFYRTHKSCAEKDKTCTAADGFMLDLIARNGD